MQSTIFGYVEKIGAYSRPYLIETTKKLPYISENAKVGLVSVAILLSTIATGALMLGSVCSCMGCKPVKAGRKIALAAMWVTIPPLLLYSIKDSLK